MDILIKFITNQYIYLPFLLWLAIQIFKFLYDLIQNKKVNFKRLVGAGGMPSSHSAIVSCLTTLIGKNLGVDTPYFAICVIFSLIVMYDAAGVRRAAGKQAKILNRIVNNPQLKITEIQEKLVEVLGHTPIEVFVGAILGIIVGIVR